VPTVDQAPASSASASVLAAGDTQPVKGPMPAPRSKPRAKPSGKDPHGGVDRAGF
jgi:hypothetical protein